MGVCVFRRKSALFWGGDGEWESKLVIVMKYQQLVFKGSLGEWGGLLLCWHGS